MPLLDLSDLVDDPDFADDTGTLFLVRTMVAVNGFGEVVGSSTPTPLTGTITPASGSVLDLLPDGARASGAILLHTKTPLHVVTDGQEADGILYRGKAYTVSALADYSAFGVGHCAAVCTLTSLTAAQPA